MAFCNYPAVLVSAAAGLTHVQSNLIFRSVGRGQIKIGGEHTGGHITQLTADNIPWTCIQLLFYPVPGKLYHTTGHIFPFVAGIAGDPAQPAGLFAELGNIKGFIKCSIYIPLLFLRASGNCHIHHIGDFADGCGSFFPAWFKNTHNLEEIGSHGSNLSVQLPVSFLFGNEPAPGGGKAFSGIQFFFQHGLPPVLFMMLLL